ncbi:hypothetical protein HMPREF1624_00137 [Sporothrix schenckii ATCC 58251]|uniref:Zn(2)-C6 fungal-type domain-containing protein n=1 Tax=Sporothrix schenckii (strain ATCC 58251 / de Perez 2211183) TaxID=1391915 RepID=U7Q1V0_SPOS1|nr:hypothetical protein HMPREF1624_00137 [Sporothrix schenckii ATCC 58251]
MTNKNIANYTSVFRVRLGDDKVASSSTTSAANNSSNDVSQLPRHPSNSNNPPIRRSQPRAKSRPVVSCQLCRSRKQKCDRLLPCGTCVRRGDGSLCRYGNEGGVTGVNAGSSSAASSSGVSVGGIPSVGSGISSSGSGHSSGHGRRPASSASSTARTSGSAPTGSALGMRQEAQLRLLRLEEMVNGLVTRAPSSRNQGATAKTPTPAFGGPNPAGTGGRQASEQGDKSGPPFEWIMPIGPNGPSSAVGPVAMMLGETPFSGPTNWTAILDSIRDIQNYLGVAALGDAPENEDEREPDSSVDHDMDDDIEEAHEEGASPSHTETNQIPNQQPNPPNSFISKPTMYGGVTDPKTALLPASLASLPAVSRRSAVPEPAETALPLAKSVSVVELQNNLPAYSSFQLAEPDGIFAAIAAAPGLAASDQSNPPATSRLALNPPLPKHLADAIACLPPRSDCDRLLAVYFQSNYMTGPFLHTGHFQRSYLRFWRTGSPAAANPMSPLLWISMLASVLCMGAMIDGGRQMARMADREPGASHADQQGDGQGASSGTGTAAGQKSSKKADPPDFSNEDLILATELRKLSTRCLLAGDYLSGRPLAVEALVLNAHVRLMQKRDSDAAQWATFGVAVRLAQRMGYHQVDAPGGGGRQLTPFEKEMRRRVWFFVESFDMLFSIQFSMPTVVHEDEIATDPPRNLNDDDFDENSAELPPSRPPSDYTTALFFITKLKLIRLLRKVMQVAVWRNAKAKIDEASSYRDSVTRITQELRWNYSTVPVRLRMPRHIRDCPFNDASHNIMHRLGVELMHHKAVCILYREALSSDRMADGGVDNRGFTAHETEMQRHACLVSALRILDLHTEFEYETRPESTAATLAQTEVQPSPGSPGANRGAGRLASDRNMLSSLALHDFLLAATILCLDLIEGSRHGHGSTRSNDNSVAGEDGTPSSRDSTAAHTAHATPASSKNLDLPPSLVFAPFLGSCGSSLEQRAQDRGAKMEALRTAYALWHERRLTSRDAAHAARVLGAIVTKLSTELGDCDAGERDYDAAGNKTRPWPDSDSPGWGRWDMEAREQRHKDYEEELKKQRAQRAERAERNKTAAIDGSGSQSDTVRSSDASSTPNEETTPASQTAESASIGTQSQARSQAQTYEVPQQQQQQPQASQTHHASPSNPPPPPPHLNYAYEWADPGPFDAVLNDPMNVDWNMVDWFLLDRQLDMDVGSNVWSADLMALEN